MQNNIQITIKKRKVRILKHIQPTPLDYEAGALSGIGFPVTRCLTLNFWIRLSIGFTGWLLFCGFGYGLTDRWLLACMLCGLWLWSIAPACLMWGKWMILVL